MINDEEGLLRSIQAYVKTNLNTQIALINTEKNDAYSLVTIPADNDHYVFAGELLDLPNHTFVNFAIEPEIQTKTNEDDKISIPTMLVEVCFDNPKKAGTYFKSLRYMRAVYQTLLRYAESANEVDGLMITKATPMIVTTFNRQLVVSGVTLDVAIS